MALNGRHGWPHSSPVLEVLRSRQPVTGAAEFDP